MTTYPIRTNGTSIKMRPMTVIPAWFCALCMSISSAGQLAHLEAMGGDTHTGYIVRVPAMGCKKRFAPVLALWHYPSYPLDI
jgi:hypothetical protein